MKQILLEFNVNYEGKCRPYTFWIDIKNPYTLTCRGCERLINEVICDYEDIDLNEGRSWHPACWIHIIVNSPTYRKRGFEETLLPLTQYLKDNNLMELLLEE